MNIFESYSSTLALDKLANDIIKYTTKFNFSRYVKINNFDKIVGFNLNQLQNNNYGEVSQYVNNSNLELHFLPFGEGESKKQKAAYGNFDQEENNKKFNPQTKKIIVVKYDPQKIKNELSLLKNINQNYLYEIFYNNLHNLLIHELQHFFDDFRTDGRLLKKGFEIDVNKLIKNDENEKLKYFNLPHEVWARFIQAYKLTKFFDITNTNGKKEYVMRDIHSVVKDFVKNMKKFHLLNDDFRKRIIRKIAQFWHYEEDKVSLYNTGKSKHGLLGIVNKNKLLESNNSNQFTNKTLISVDIQPEYESAFNFKTYMFTDFINNNIQKNNVVLLYNGDSMSMVTETDYMSWLIDNDLNEDYLYDITFYDKGYAFFRYCMDYNIEDELIVDLIKFMKNQNITDSRYINSDMWDEFIKMTSHSHNEIRELLENADDMINIPELMDFLSDFNNIILFGGGINECLKEVEIALMALGKPYQIFQELTY